MWLKDVGGSLELGDVWWPKVPLPSLPPLVPVVGGQVRRLPPWPAWGVRWDRVVSKSGRRIQDKWLKGNAQDALGAPADVAVVRH